MTDQTTLTDEDRRLARKWAANIIRTPRTSLPTEVAAAKAILRAVPAAPRPTLADMTLTERDECAGMQADLAQGDRVVILDGTPDSDGLVQVLEKSLDVYRPRPVDVTPRPDLPRLEWPDADQGGEEVTKVDYVSVAGGRTAYGPWTVARLRKKADTTPALPEGWRLADHEKHGRVVVTTPTPDDDGDFYFVFPADDLTGYDWDACSPDELTYTDTPDAVPPNTLAVGSVWIGVDALTRACEESGRDQIVVSDFGGYVSVWDNDANWWEGSAPPRTTPYTIIHTGKEADK